MKNNTSIPQENRMTTKKSKPKKESAPKKTQAKKAAAKQPAVTTMKQLAESGVPGVQKTTMFKVDPSQVHLEKGFNLREKTKDLEDHLERMYTAMKNGAYFPPIDVVIVDGKITVRDGHCRTLTAQRLQKEGLPVMLEARQLRGNDADQVLHMLGSDQGKSFTPLEQGRGFLRLIKFGMSNSDIAAKTGQHLTTISNGLLLAEAPAAVQKMIASEQISVNVALRVLRKKQGQEVTDALQRMIDDAAGKKVTPGVAEGPRVKPAVARTLFECTNVIKQCLDGNFYNEVMSMSDDALESKTIPVPAKVLRAMLSTLEPLKETKTEAVTTVDDDEL